VAHGSWCGNLEQQELYTCPLNTPAPLCDGRAYGAAITDWENTMKSLDRRHSILSRPMPGWWPALIAGLGGVSARAGDGAVSTNVAVSRNVMSRRVLLSLFAWLPLMILLASHSAAAQPAAFSLPPAARARNAGSAPAITHTAYLPLMSLPEKPSGRIGTITPLSTSVPRYTKFEIAFTISTTATNFYFPYDPAAPVDASGVTVDMLITDTTGSLKTVPCFYYQPIDANLTPVGQPDWRCRYAPEAMGTWRYRVRLTDALGQAASAENAFEAVASNSHGFVRVSPADSHYFELDDGTPLVAPLINAEWSSPLNSLDLIRTTIPRWGQNGVRFVRWFPTGEGGNPYIVPFSDDMLVSWGFGPTSSKVEADPVTGNQFTFAPYYYTNQTVKATRGARYRLTFRAKVTGSKVLRPELGSSTLEIRASAWQTYTLETTSTDTELTVWLHDGYSENDNTPGTIRLDAITLQRDETGHGGWGPNLLSRGNPDTYQYVDQVGAARLDEVMRLSEQYGVYHKLALFHKNDNLLGVMKADGTITTNWDIDNFYSQDGAVPRWLEKAYARYFVARWSYSTALHSLELANENMLTTPSYEAAYSVLGYIRSLEPRHILLSNSFWGYYVDPYWNSLRYGPLMDYVDKHWYARSGSGDEELVSTLTNDTAANVRQCRQRFDDYRSWYTLNKPVVRGETGVWQPGTNNPLDLGSGAATYYHKQVWAQMGDQCAGEWYTDYPEQHNLWGDYQRYEQFLQGEPLANGRYADIGSDTGAIAVANTAGTARAWGKLDATAGRGVLWIDNAGDTWKRVADGLSVTPATASLEISGLPNGAYQATWFNTATGTTNTTAHTVSNGKLTLSVAALAHDVAVKFRKQ
jgi:hypothetical protein